MLVHVPRAICPSTMGRPFVCEVCVRICVWRCVFKEMHLHVGCGILTCGGVCAVCGVGCVKDLSAYLWALHSVCEGCLECLKRVC